MRQNGQIVKVFPDTKIDMARVIQCPHYWTDGFAWGCFKGKFPCDCEKCNCEDKTYYDISTTTNTYVIGKETNQYIKKKKNNYG